MTDSPVDTQQEGQGNILGVLRQARKKIGMGAKPLDLPVPGYDNALVLRFRWIPLSELGSSAKKLGKIENQHEQNIAIAGDLLVKTCENVLINVDGELRPIATDGTETTFKDGDVLSEALGFPKPDSALLTCISVFNNEYAVIALAMTVSAWLEDTSKKVDAEFVGE